MRTTIKQVSQQLNRASGFRSDTDRGGDVMRGVLIAGEINAFKHCPTCGATSAQYCICDSEKEQAAKS